MPSAVVDHARRRRERAEPAPRRSGRIASRSRKPRPNGRNAKTRRARARSRGRICSYIGKIRKNDGHRIEHQRRRQPAQQAGLAKRLRMHQRIAAARRRAASRSARTARRRPARPRARRSSTTASPVRGPRSAGRPARPASRKASSAPPTSSRESLSPRLSGNRNSAAGNGQRRHRQVDEKHRAPTERAAVDQQPRQDLSDDGGRADHEAEQAERLRLLVRPETDDGWRPAPAAPAPPRRRPESSRPATSAFGDQAKPQSAEAAAKPARPIRKTRRRP